jgi:hypothetical protein
MSDGEQQPPLVEQLLLSAQAFAQAGFSYLPRTDPAVRDFLPLVQCSVNLGISLEFLLKATLADRHPALLVGAESFSKAVSARDGSARLILDLVECSFDFQSVRSCSAEIALARCREIHGKPDEHSAQQVIAARNGAIHVGQRPNPQRHKEPGRAKSGAEFSPREESALTPMETLVGFFYWASSDLLHLLGRSPEWFWREHWTEISDLMRATKAHDQAVADARLLLQQSNKNPMPLK